SFHPKVCDRIARRRGLGYLAALSAVAASAQTTFLQGAIEEGISAKRALVHGCGCLRKAVHFTICSPNCATSCVCRNRRCTFLRTLYSNCIAPIHLLS